MSNAAASSTVLDARSEAGHVQTENGVLPDSWSARKLAELFSLKNGLAFSSAYFSQEGPIVLTPGNFRLEGGLYFDDRNTKRYSGPYPPEAVFHNGDLLIVMTDLTPDCNLLGKPAFVEMGEPVLHNQRIGKVILRRKDIEPRFLYYVLLSRLYLDRIKEMATGSTVRHTSNGSIYSVQVPLPSLPEQRAIAAALSDVDELIGALDKLIAKKRAIKLATMQQLLTGKTRLSGFSGEWKSTTLGELAEIQRGASPRPIESPIWYDTQSKIGWVRISDIANSDGRTLLATRDYLSPMGVAASRFIPTGTLIMSICATIGRPVVTGFDTCIHDGFVSFCNLRHVDQGFLFYTLKELEADLAAMGQTGSQANLNTDLVKGCEISLPSVDEQKAIAGMLSDMDTEIAALEQRRDKTKAIKQGMMQSLLTGRMRLVPGEADA
ncbi:MAG: restriction endonuclease subunit S [bacterium]|nr:restriction endonuclease subunit S [bacterium]